MVSAVVPMKDNVASRSLNVQESFPEPSGEPEIPTLHPVQQIT